MEKYKIFISYSWEDDEHNGWVEKFAKDLDRYKELDINFDGFTLTPFQDMNEFMENGIYKSNLVIMICTKEYKRKADNREGGVGKETYMGTYRHWEEMLKNKESNFICVLREKDSAPNFMLGKFHALFYNNEKYEDNLEYLVCMLKDRICPKSKRPEKTKSIFDKKTKYFSFNRAEEIISISGGKKRKLLDHSEDDSNIKKINYQYFEATFVDTEKKFLFIFDNKNMKDIFESFLQKYKKNYPRKLIIITEKNGNVSYFEKILLEKKINIDISRYSIQDYYWNICIEDDENIEIYEDDFFVDQRIYSIEDNRKINLGPTIKYMLDTFLQENNNICIFMLFASGGMGKSTLSNVLTNQINNRKNCKAMLIQSEMIRNSITSDAKKNFEIKNIFQLYDVYGRMNPKENNHYSKEKFELGVITGKIIVIVDGLDEIISLFQESFYLDEFLTSLEELNLQLGKSKVIITSRLNILENNSYLENDENINIAYLKGFEEDNWEHYMNLRFNKYNDVTKYIKRVNKYIDTLLQLSSQDKKERVILPFFMDLICGIVEDDFSDGKSNLIINTIGNEYATNNEEIDYLIFSILNREIERQEFSINIKHFIMMFYELALKYGESFSKENLREYIEVYFETYSDEIYSKLLLNPLLKSIEKQNRIYFKYDILTNYFKTLGIINYIAGNVNSLDNDFINVLSKSYEGSSDMLADIVKYFKNNIDLCITNSKKILDLLIKEIKKDSTKNCLRYKHAISSLLYLTQKIYGETLSQDKRIEIIKKLYSSDTQINYFYIWGTFFPIDLSNIELMSVELHEFNSFSQCKFMNTMFKHSLFSNIKDFSKAQFSKKNYEEETCYFINIEKNVETENDRKEEDSKALKILLNNFFDGMKFESKHFDNITIKSVHVRKKKEIIDNLIKKGILKKEENLKNYYKLDNRYYRSVKNFKSNKNIDILLREIKDIYTDSIK
jgi:hypothetical protein